MTLPAERTRAVQYARDFLRDLLDPQITPKVPKPIREMARRILRHFPGSYDMHLAAKALSSTFGETEETKHGEKQYNGSYRDFRASLYGVRSSRKQRSSKSRR